MHIQPHVDYILAGNIFLQRTMLRHANVQAEMKSLTGLRHFPQLHHQQRLMLKGSVESDLYGRSEDKETTSFFVGAIIHRLNSELTPVLKCLGNKVRQSVIERVHLTNDS